MSDVTPLSDKQLSSMGRQLGTFGYGVHCHSSSAAGAGKSFDIRTKGERFPHILRSTNTLI